MACETIVIISKEGFFIILIGTSYSVLPTHSVGLNLELINEANQRHRIFEGIEQLSHSFTDQMDPEQIRRSVL
ncbi:hypothetical protein CWR48_17330 [Oceanobacillus arenosus]|uniref:Uncharacterized protein n=1 Tax=Oceanobacillus arenosus TaxID=1229153 RepID=A0A3D8PJZ2_9BACI|nr:hypothetical protein CWR48_17330 [Oceanobacillus arenosus]